MNKFNVQVCFEDKPSELDVSSTSIALQIHRGISKSIIRRVSKTLNKKPDRKKEKNFETHIL